MCFVLQALWALQKTVWLFSQSKWAPDKQRNGKRLEPLADPGGPGDLAPLPPKYFFSNSCSFQATKGKNNLFWAHFALRALLGSKLYWAPLTEFLDPPLHGSVPLSTAHPQNMKPEAARCISFCFPLWTWQFQRNDIALSVWRHSLSTKSRFPWSSCKSLPWQVTQVYWVSSVHLQFMVAVVIIGSRTNSHLRMLWRALLKAVLNSVAGASRGTLPRCKKISASKEQTVDFSR